MTAPVLGAAIVVQGKAREMKVITQAGVRFLREVSCKAEEGGMGLRGVQSLTWAVLLF